MICIGIDPGASGGVAVLRGSTDDPVLFPLKDRTLKEMWNWFKNLDIIEDPNDEWDHGTFAVIEKVGGYVSGEGFAAGGAAMFNFGKGVGWLEAFLTASETPWDVATPQKWQKALGIVSRGKTESKTEFKNRLKGTAERLFPKVKVTHAVADALLIAEYCRRTRR